MTAKTSYTESELAAYMVGVLDAVATGLGLTTSSPSILAAVTGVERLLGVSDVADVTDMAVLEAAAEWKARGVAYSTAVMKADEIKAGSASLKWSERVDGLREALTLAEGAYYTALAESEAASGSSSFFGFATVCGSRGR
jgi:hypothetical protein